MLKSILLVGHCASDRRRFQDWLTTNLPVDVISSDSIAETIEVVAERNVTLLLINRVLDVTDERGLELIRHLAATKAAPTCMLISNFDDAQQQAIAAGAAPGFGKVQLGTDVALELVRNCLDNIAA